MKVLNVPKCLTAVGVLPALAMAVLAMGCAGGQRVELAYSAVPPDQPTTTRGPAIYIAPFEDRREDPQTVGEIRTASLVRPDAKVRLRRGDVPSWVRDALAEELKLRGYRVLERDEDARWQVYGAVHELFYTEGGFVLTQPRAVMTLETQVVADEHVIPGKVYRAKAEAKTSDGQPADPADLLETVLRRVLKQFLRDLEATRRGLAEDE